MTRWTHWRRQEGAAAAAAHSRRAPAGAWPLTRQHCCWQAQCCCYLLLITLLPLQQQRLCQALPAATPAAAGTSMQCTLGTEKSGSGTTANWPTYHFMNNVTRNASGVLFLEPLNDANAIAEYKGKSFASMAMMSEGGQPLVILDGREGNPL